MEVGGDEKDYPQLKYELVYASLKEGRRWGPLYSFFVAAGEGRPRLYKKETSFQCIVFSDRKGVPSRSRRRMEGPSCPIEGL